MIHIVTNTINERVAKICFALKLKNVKYVCLFQNFKKGQYFKDLNLNFVNCTNSNDIICYLNKNNVKFIHLYSFAFDQLCLDIINNTKLKIIYEPKDVFKKVMNLNIDENIVNGQEYLLKSVNGLIFRDFQSHLCANLNDFNLNKNRLYFPDFCWPEQAGIKRKIHLSNKKENEIKLVFSGNFYIEKHSPKLAAAGIYHILKEMVHQGFNVNLFPFIHNNLEHTEWFSDYKNLELENENFKIHNALEPINLINKYQDFDYGCHLYQGEHFGNLPQRYEHEDFGQYGISSRIFDYISAGIPIINSSDFKYINRLLYHCKNNVSISKNELFKLKNILSNIEYPKLRLRSLKSYYKLKIDRHINKLLKFYALYE